MTGLHKFRPKKHLHVIMAIAVVCAVTWKSNARRTIASEIYSSLTRDTSKPRNSDTVFQKPITTAAASADTTVPKRSSIPDSLRTTADSTISDSALTQRVDTFSLRMSKDTLDAPVN